MDVLIRKRGIIKGKVTRFETYAQEIESALNAENGAISDKQAFQLQERLDACISHLAEFDDIQAQIDELVDDIETEAGSHLEFENKYFSTISLARSLLAKIKPEPAVVSSHVNSPGSTRSSHGSQSPYKPTFMKLPTIHLAKFKGNLEGWLEFRDIYNDMIHENQSLTKIQKFHYLRSSLAGTPLQIISSLEFTADKYQVAWDSLRKRYDNPRMLVLNHIKAIFNLESLTKESSAKLRHINDTLLKHVNSLKSLATEQALFEAIIIYITSGKLDSTTSRQWETKKNDTGTELPTLKEFEAFVKNQADLLETLESKQTKPVSDKPKALSKSFVASNLTCLLCKKSHSLSNCEDFLKLSAADRPAKVKELKLCLNCLHKGHFLSQCNSRYTCRACKSKHHTLLHEERDKAATYAQPTFSAPPEPRVETNLTVSAFSSNQIHVLLPTASAIILDSAGNSHSIRVLLDSGSQSNFVTKSLCKKLKLNVSDADLTVTSLSKATSKILFKCDLRAHQGPYKVKTSCLVINAITGSLPGFHVNTNHLKIPDNIKLSDLSYDRPGEIDILLGSSVFCDLLCIGQLEVQRNSGCSKTKTFLRPKPPERNLYGLLGAVRDSAKTRTTKANSKNDIVLLSKRPLSNNTKVARPPSSTSTLRSNTSNETVSHESVSISKYEGTGTKSAASISTRVKPRVVLSAKKTETRAETSNRWFGVSTKTKSSPPLQKQTKPPAHSTVLLHHNNNNNEVKIHGKLKKPIDSSKVSSRRGQSQASSKSEQGQLQGQIREDLSRSSSVTNLNADHKNKGAFSKLRKSASKDKLDKLTDKKNEKKGISSNNNKVDSGEVDHSLESLQEIELLQRQLTEMAKEKSDLALELGERKGELQILKNEIVKLKMFQDQSNVRIEQLNDENTALRNRLRDVAHSPLSDNEKQQLLESHRHSSAPASIATNILEDSNVGDITACPTPDWDKHSSSNVSEVSVACLQDKINQMQETHYSTNEELQATLQELTDLQRQLTELQQDNERLLDEKNLMFDSLCRQTERLNDARAEVESLKQLLYRDRDETGQFESIVDREQKLVDLLKSAQEERETLLVKQEQLSNELQDVRTANIEQITEIEQLTERVRTLESTLDAKHAEHRQLDQELAIAKDQCSGRQIEINRLTDLLDNARTKINELEQERALNDKSELDELLDNARKEKDALESEVANLKEQVARSRNETDKLREQVSILQEECKVTRNNAKCTQSELEYKCEKLTADKTNLNEQLQQLQEAANELQVQAQCQLEDKRQLSSVLSETQRNLSEAERKNTELGTEIDELKRLRKEENEEWEKFQNDLLTSVRVANDFKSEAQQELQKMIMENKAHRERVRQLEAQIDKLKGDSGRVTQETTEATVSSSHNYHLTDSTREVSQIHEKEDTNPMLNTRVQPAIISHKTYPDINNREQCKDIEVQPNLTSNSNFLVVPLTINSDIKQDTSANTELEQNVSDNSAIKNALKFLPTLSLISRKSNTKPESSKKVSSSEKQSSDSDTTRNLARYADSSKIINFSHTAGVTESTQEKSEKFAVKKYKTPKLSHKHPEKRLSDQEERNIAILFNLYSQIDQNIPKEQLTEEQKFILKLKDIFDGEASNPKLKPVAKTSKDKLAISKPLLNSVLNNPKLKEIAEDSRMVDVENDLLSETFKEDAFSSEFKEFVASDPNFSKRYEMILKPEAKFEDLFQSNIQFSYYNDEQRPKSLSSFKPEPIITKSKSLDNIYYKDRILKNEQKMTYNNNSLDLPNSISSFTKIAHNELDVNESSHPANIDNKNANPETTDESELMKNVTFENLDVLYAKINRNIPESQLTKEEQFIIKLKQSLDEMGRKNTLRKMATKRRKKLKISEPTETSILMNPKLVSILNNPSIQVVENANKKHKEETHNRLSEISLTSSIKISEIEDQNNEDPLSLDNKSMSYEDVSATNNVDILDPNFEFKLPRAKLISSTPDVSEESTEIKANKFSSFSMPHLPNYYSVEEFNNGGGRYIKNKQEEHLKWASAPFYRVKRAYDLQVLRPSFDRRKISLNEPQSDSEAICILPKSEDFNNANSEHLSDEATQSYHEPIDKTSAVCLDDGINNNTNDHEKIKKNEVKETKIDSFSYLHIVKQDNKGKQEKIEANLNMQSKTLNCNENSNHALETIQEINPEETKQCIFEVNDCNPSFHSIIIPNIRTDSGTISNTSSTNVEVLDSLKSRLDEEEFDLIQRIQSSSDYSRPNSGLNEEDLKLIAFAQQQCSEEEDNVKDRAPFKSNVDKTFLIEEDNENALLETKMKGGELVLTEELECNRIDSGLSAKVANNTKMIVECYNSNVDTIANNEKSFQMEKIGSSSVIENALSAPLGNSTVNTNNQATDDLILSSERQLTLQEPIYANYSMFLKQMIHDDKEQEILSVVKKQPLPLPRSMSINEDLPQVVKTINKVGSDNLSESFDKCDLVDSTPTSPTDISKITRDISNLTNNLENLEDTSHHTNQDMITGCQTSIDKINISGSSSDTTSIKVFDNIENSSYSKTEQTFVDDEELFENIDTSLKAFGGAKKKHSGYSRTFERGSEDLEKYKSAKGTTQKSSIGGETFENTGKINTASSSSEAASVKTFDITGKKNSNYSRINENFFENVERYKLPKDALQTPENNKEVCENIDKRINTSNASDTASVKAFGGAIKKYSSYSRAGDTISEGAKKYISSEVTTQTSIDKENIKSTEKSNDCDSTFDSASIKVFGGTKKIYSDYSRADEPLLKDLAKHRCSEDITQKSTVESEILENAEKLDEENSGKGYLSKSNIKVFGNVEKYRALEYIKEFETKYNDESGENKHSTGIEVATSAVKFFDSEKISTDHEDVHIANKLTREEPNFPNDRTVELTHTYELQENQNIKFLNKNENRKSLNKTEDKHNLSTETNEENLEKDLLKDENIEGLVKIEDEQNVSTDTADNKHDLHHEISDKAENKPNVDHTNATGGFSIFGIIDKLGHIIHAVTTAAQPTLVTENVATDSCCTKNTRTQTESAVVERHVRHKKKTKRAEKSSEANYDTLERIAAFHIFNNPPIPHLREYAPHVCRYHNIPLENNNSSQVCQRGHRTHPSSDYTNYDINLQGNLPQQCPHILDYSRQSSAFSPEIPNFKYEAPASYLPTPANRSSIGDSIKKFETIIQANQQQNIGFKSETLNATFTRFKKTNPELTCMSPEIRLEREEADNNIDIVEDTKKEKPLQ